MRSTSVWTLRYEMACYVLAAALGVLAARVRLLALGGAFAAAWLVTWARPDPGGVYRLLRFASFFLAGALFYELRAHVRLTASTVVTAIGGIASGLAAGRVDAVLPLCGSYLLLAAAFARWLPVAGFGRYGDFSYGLYLYAYPIQQLVLHVGAGHAPPLLVLGVSFPVTVALAAVSWRWIEAPALALKRAAGRAPVA